MSLKFTKNTKNTVDILVPVAGAGLAFYYMNKKEGSDLKNSAITTAIVLVGLYIITTQITKKLLAAANKPADIPVPNDTAGAIDNNNTDPTTNTFNASSWAKRLYDDISPFNWFQTGHDAKLYADMVLLSNQNLIAIYNAWNSEYADQYNNKSLVQAMKDESYPNMINGTKDKVNTIIDRLSQMGAA